MNYLTKFWFAYLLAIAAITATWITKGWATALLVTAVVTAGYVLYLLMITRSEDDTE